MRWHWVRFRCFVHATEDEARVRAALVGLLGQGDDAKGNDRIERKRAKGHWGNDIVVLEGALTKNAPVERSLSRLFADDALRSAVLASLPLALDEDGVLHVRLDKQAAVTGLGRTTGGGDAVVLTAKGERMPGTDLLKDWKEYLSAAPTVTDAPAR